MHFLEADLTLIVFINLNISGILNEIVQDLAAITLEMEYKSLEFISDPTTDENKVKQIAGVYRYGQDFWVPNSSIEIFESKGFFYTEGHPHQEKIRLLKISENEFIHRQHWAKIRFKWSDDGHITGMKYGSFELLKETYN